MKNIFEQLKKIITQWIYKYLWNHSKKIKDTHFEKNFIQQIQKEYLEAFKQIEKEKEYLQHQLRFAFQMMLSKNEERRKLDQQLREQIAQRSKITIERNQYRLQYDQQLVLLKQLEKEEVTEQLHERIRLQQEYVEEAELKLIESVKAYSKVQQELQQFEKGFDELLQEEERYFEIIKNLEKEQHVIHQMYADVIQEKEREINLLSQSFPSEKSAENTYNSKVEQYISKRFQQLYPYAFVHKKFIKDFLKCTEEEQLQIEEVMAQYYFQYEQALPKYRRMNPIKTNSGLILEAGYSHRGRLYYTYKNNKIRWIRISRSKNGGELDQKKIIQWLKDNTG